MRTVMVRYRVKPECVQENERLVRAVYEELAESKPPGLRYATFKLDDGVSFVHVAATTTKDENPLLGIGAFAEFTKDVGERCEEPPQTSELHEVGSFEFRP